MTVGFPFRKVTHLEGRRAVIAVAVICALGLAYCTCFAVMNKDRLGIDFNQFYAASHLAGTGHVYDWDALRKIEAQNAPEVPTGRLPVVLYGHKILSRFSYPVARALWMALSIAALILVALTWPGARPRFMLMALTWSLPATVVVLFGQDVPFWLLFFTAGLLLLGRNRPWLAGVAFSLCICKFHLALGIPVMLAAQKRWRTLIAGAIGVLAWIASCFLIEGPGWPLAYLNISKIPEFSPAPERMPSLYGLASWLPWTTALELVSGMVVVWLLWGLCRGGQDLGMAGAAAAACGVLLAHHSYAGDCTLQIPLAILTIQRQAWRPWLKAWAVLTLTPASVVLIVWQPYLGQILTVPFVVAAVWAARAKPLTHPLEESLAAA